MEEIIRFINVYDIAFLIYMCCPDQKEQVFSLYLWGDISEEPTHYVAYMTAHKYQQDIPIIDIKRCQQDVESFPGVYVSKDWVT